ncbi:MAG: serine hydrolase domain-containing protein [Allomuricauda sp.]
MKHKLFTLVIILISINSLAQNSNAKYINTWQEKIYKAANKELKESGTPSLQIAIGLRDTIIFEKAFGMADLENNVPATIESKYRSASVTKWWTATAAMILANQGMLDLDAPIQNYCSIFPIKKWPITTRQLLTHTSGVRSYIDLEEEMLKINDDIDSLKLIRRYEKELLGTYTHYTNVNDPLNNFMEDSLNFEPGTNWSYSSQGYRILGCVIEAASGKEYRELMKELVFIPARMENTIEDDAWAIISNRVSGYQFQRGEPLRRTDIRDVSENLPAGGYLTNASDLVRFAQAFLNHEFFKSKTILLMSNSFSNDSQVITGEQSWRDAIPSKEKYGYGIMLFPDSETVRFGHTGRQAGGSCIVIVVPEKKLSIAIMTNAKGWNGYMSFSKVIEQIITENFKI